MSRMNVYAWTDSDQNSNKTCKHVCVFIICIILFGLLLSLEMIEGNKRGTSHCDPGYYLNPLTNECDLKECNCKNGYSALGEDCPEHGMNKCYGCYSGENLEWVRTGWIYGWEESYCRRVNFTAKFVQMKDNDGFLSGGLDPCFEVYNHNGERDKKCISLIVEATY